MNKKNEISSFFSIDIQHPKKSELIFKNIIALAEKNLLHVFSEALEITKKSYKKQVWKKKLVKLSQRPNPSETF